MRNFKSGWLTRQGEILHLDETDSHEDIAEVFGIKDTGISAIRWEFTPQNGKWADINDYALRVDESSVPEWYHEYEEKLLNFCREFVSRKIITADKKILTAGTWIIGGEAKIGSVKCVSRIISIGGSAQVKYIEDSAQVENIEGSAQVEYIGGSAQVENIEGSAQVENIGGSAQVKYIEGSATVVNDARTK